MAKVLERLVMASAMPTAIVLTPARPALAATPADMLVIAKQTDDIISLDPAGGPTSSPASR